MDALPALGGLLFGIVGLRIVWSLALRFFLGAV